MIKDVEKKISNTSGPAKKTDYNKKKIKVIQKKIPSVTSLVTISDLNTNAKEIEKKSPLLLIWLLKLL